MGLRGIEEQLFIQHICAFGVSISVARWLLQAEREMGSLLSVLRWPNTSFSNGFVEHLYI